MFTFFFAMAAHQVSAAEEPSTDACQQALNQCKGAWKQADGEKEKKFKFTYPCQKDCLEAQKICHQLRKEARNKGDKKVQANADENLMSASAHSLDCQKMYKLSPVPASEKK